MFLQCTPMPPGGIGFRLMAVATAINYAGSQGLLEAL